MKLEMDETLFGALYPYIQDDDITDIRWNGHALWVENLKKGRYRTDVKLDDEFLGIFTQRIANMQNINFNSSMPSLQASTETLRIHCIHPFRTGDHTYSLSIRKVPAVVRINEQSIKETKYAQPATIELLAALIRNRYKGIIIGDVGAGKTELLKYLARYIPDNMSTLTAEDTLEMKLPALYPGKDISSVLLDEKYPAEQAIRDALRLETRYLWLAEARGREIARIMEGASTGCTVWTTIHTNNVWDIPDRIVQMTGNLGDDKDYENDVFAFFDVGVKVEKVITDHGIRRYIDQICFFERDQKENRTVTILKNGHFTGETIPESIIEKLQENEEKRTLHLLQQAGLVPGKK